MSRPISALLIGLLASGCAATYLVKPGTADPTHVVRCDYSEPGFSWIAPVFLMPIVVPLAHREGHERCVRVRTSQGYVAAPEPPCAYWRDDKEPGHQVVVRDACKLTPPDWAAR